MQKDQHYEEFSMSNNNIHDDENSKDFELHLKSLKEIYKQSTLKEKHKINEHIKFILQKHSSQSTDELERHLK